MSTAFVDLARRNAAYKGLPSLAVVEVLHPIGGVKPDIIRQRAVENLENVLQALVAPEQAPRPRA